MRTGPAVAGATATLNCDDVQSKGVAHGGDTARHSPFVAGGETFIRAPDGRPGHHTQLPYQARGDFVPFQIPLGPIVAELLRVGRKIRQRVIDLAYQ